MPFGWKGAPAAFQSTMDTLLQRGIHDGFITVYMDDILVHSRNMDDHINHLGWVFDTLSKAYFRLNPEKCLFALSEVEFLGHKISSKGVFPKEDKLDSIANLKQPKNLRELRGLLGTLGFYQTFVPNFATLARPMSKLLSAKQEFRWGPEQDAALSSIKRAFASINPLSLIDPENTKGFVLITDASANAIGAQLLRVNNNNDQLLVMNVSRALSPTEQRYSNTERELLSVVWALNRLELIMCGKRVDIYTDHAALIPILLGSVKRVSTPRVERLRLKLSRFIPYGLTIQHVPGKLNTADTLSRPGHLARLYSDMDNPNRTSLRGGEGATLSPILKQHGDLLTQKIARNLGSLQSTAHTQKGTWSWIILIGHLVQRKIKTLPQST